MFEKKNKDEEMKKLWALVQLLQEQLNRIEERLNKLELVMAKERTYTSTIKGFNTEEDYQKFHDICSEIAIKDETFKFEGNREAKEIYIYLDDKDKLHKRSMWFIKKTNISNLKYTIR